MLPLAAGCFAKDFHIAEEDAGEDASVAGVSLVAVIPAAGVGGDGDTISLAVPAAGVSAGVTVVVWGSNGSGDAAQTATVEDSRGNDYGLDFAVAVDSDEVLNAFVASARVATPLAAGDAITVNFGDPTYSIRLAAGAVFAGLADAERLDETAGASGNGIALDSGATLPTAQADEPWSARSWWTPISPPPSRPEPASRQSIPSRRLPSASLRFTPFTASCRTTDAYRAAATISSAAQWTAALATYRAAE